MDGSMLRNGMQGNKPQCTINIGELQQTRDCRPGRPVGLEFLDVQGVGVKAEEPKVGGGS